MKIFLFNALIFVITTACLNAQSEFDKHFTAGSMRIDLVIAGDYQKKDCFLLTVKKEPSWGGTQKNLVDTLNLGEYRFIILDKNSNDTLYISGFSTLFEEWQTTPEAKTMSKAFFHTITFPYPKAEIIIHVESRNAQGLFEPLFRSAVNPESDNIRQEEIAHVDVHKIIDNGPAKSNLDLVFIAEGYQASEMKKFQRDVHRFSQFLMMHAPFDEFKQQINIWAVCAPSMESGTDIPHKNKWVNTAVHSSFNTFNIERYLESEDVVSIRDYAALAPYDHIVVLVNSDRYGGGGIYNHFSIVTADHSLSETVLVHELGHGIAGLADEYYTSDVAYQNFFNLSVEPWQPNITTLVNFDRKWKNQLPADLPIPTPDESKHYNNPGVFEGGGYVEKGIYRSAPNCRMKSNEAKSFCDICQDAIRKTIKFRTE